MMEQHHITERGGPTNRRNPDGGLANKRNQMNEKRYQEALKRYQQPPRR